MKIRPPRPQMLERTNQYQPMISSKNPPQIITKHKIFVITQADSKILVVERFENGPINVRSCNFSIKRIDPSLSQPVLSPKWRGRASKRSTSSLAASSCRKAIKPLRPPPTMMTSYIAIRQEKTKKNQSHRSCSKILKLASSS